jgi:hypothetical protein
MGGGGGNKAAEAAQRAEEQRRANILATQQRIEAIYGNPQREKDIQSIIAATRQYLGRDLSEKNSQQSRQLKFALARGGQTGGSYDVDSHRLLGEDYLRAALDNERRAQGTGNSLRAADQESKMNLFSQAANGLDMTTASRNALQAMQVNLGNAKTQTTQDGIGDFFSNLGDVYSRSREAAGQRQAERYQYGTFYAPTGAGGNGGWGG